MENDFLHILGQVVDRDVGLRTKISLERCHIPVDLYRIDFIYVFCDMERVVDDNYFVVIDNLSIF